MHPLSECDVENLDNLAVFRYKRKQWVEMLGGKDPHSIFNQLTTMLFNDVFYRVVNETRRLNSETDRQQNGRLHHFIDSGFVASQSLGIRRLTDSYTGQKNRAVISLPRILDDIEVDLGLITRENYICYDGAKYDGSGSSVLDGLHHTTQKAFDKLSGVKPAARSRSDLIQPGVIAWLRKGFKKCESIRRYANKYLAHASDPNNRGDVNGPSLNELDDCYKILCSVCNCISSLLLFDTSFSFVAIPPFGDLEFLDIPVSDPVDLPFLDDFATKRRSDLEKFGEYEIPENF